MTSWSLATLSSMLAQASTQSASFWSQTVIGTVIGVAGGIVTGLVLVRILKRTGADREKH